MQRSGDGAYAPDRVSAFSLLVAGGGIPGGKISFKSTGNSMYEKACQRGWGWDVRFFDRNL